MRNQKYNYVDIISSLIKMHITREEQLIIHDNYLIIELGYSQTLIVNYADGVKIFNSFKNVEKLEESYKSGHITPINSDEIKFRIMSKQEYLARKMAAVLKIDAAMLIEKD